VSTPATDIDSLTALLAQVAQEHEPLVQVSSLGPEDMLISEVIARARLPIRVLTIDTGRLPAQTYALIAQAQGRWAASGLQLGVIFPEAAAVEAFVHRHGIDGFTASVAARKACCEARKVRPLARALAGQRGWITGLRRAQSAERAGITELEWDVAPGPGEPGRVKINPLARWHDDALWSALRQLDVPVNALHAQGYPSIGCAPCTRAVSAGEDPRAGRWWWEQSEVKECGLHVGADGRLRRAATPDPAQRLSPAEAP
jgi:phosphoadenosine phosphosulfate reductase